MEVIIPDTHLIAVIPQIIILSGASVILWMSFLTPGLRKSFSFLTFGICVASILAMVLTWNDKGSYFSGMITLDVFTKVFNILILAGSALISLLTHRVVEEKKSGEFYSIILLSTLGMMVMASSQHLLVIYLGLEILSIGLYILIGMNRTQVRALESAMKYFLLGAFASGFFLYGIALTYGATGSMDLIKINNFLTTHNLLGDALMLTGTGLIFVGLAFKITMG